MKLPVVLHQCLNLHNEDADATQTNDTKEQCDLIDANDYNGLKIDERASAEVNKDDNENQMVGENITVQKDDCRVSLNCMNIDSTSSSQSFRYEDLKDGNKRKSNVSQKTGKEKQSNQEKKSKVPFLSDNLKLLCTLIEDIIFCHKCGYQNHIIIL